MIKPAQLYTEEIERKFWEITYDDFYMYLNDGYFEEYIPSKSTWNEREFVSISKYNKVLGYIRYGINQRSNIVTSLCAINFSKNLLFAKDLFKVIDDIFCKHKYNKLKYGVFVGNPIEKTYDKLTEKYGGRIIGISIKDAKLSDGNFHDYKTYELFRDDYLKNCHIKI